MQQQQQWLPRQMAQLEVEDTTPSLRAAHKPRSGPSAHHIAWLRLLPLALVLLAQAITALVTLHNTVFLDEATYIYAGIQLLQHSATIGQYATYFSGYPAFYPVLAGALDRLGGLELVRLFSTGCMLIVTTCVFILTQRLFGRASAYAASILFAFTGPVLFLTRLATFDALALTFLAVATTLATIVPTMGKRTATLLALVTGLLIPLAFTAKYAALLFAPFVVALVGLHTYEEHRDWWRATRYLVLVTLSSVTLLWFASPLITAEVLRGLGSTTTSRAAMIPAPPSKLLATIIPAGITTWVLGIIGLCLIPLRQRLVAVLLLVASLAAPLYHLHSGESTSLYKHMGFALFFAAPLAGTALVNVVRRIAVLRRRQRLLQFASVPICIVLLAIAGQSAHTHYIGWSNTSRLVATMAPLLSGRPTARCLCEDAKIIQYELSATTAAWQYVDPYYFHYQATDGTSLDGDTAYTAAIMAGYFSVIELSFANPIAHVAVSAIHSGHAHYHLIAKLPQSLGANAYFLVWVRDSNRPLPPVQPLHVAGNHLVTANGTIVQLHGINRDGSDFLCAEGHGIFDGPADPDYTQTMLSWHINSVRIPLNEGCWLGVGSVPTPYSGKAYQRAIINYVDTLTSQGIYVILDLHKLAFGSQADTHVFRDIPDAAYAIPFWQQVATQFKTNKMVLFELFNEPHSINWSCWRDGGHCTGVPYLAAGMQTLVDAVRQTQATNIIVLPGLRYGNDMTGWLAAMPNDPQHNLVASWHVYTASDPCATRACYDRELLPIVRQVPLINTEFGTDAHGIICGTQGIGPMLSWSDLHHASYLAWTWNVGSQTCGGLSLISNWDGTPKAPNGTFFYQWLLTHD